MESHVGIICGKSPLPPVRGLVDTLSACLPSLRPLLNLVLFGSIDRSHRRNPSDKKPSNGPSAHSYNIWDSHMRRHQTIASEASEMESSRSFARLPEGGNKAGTYISASDDALEDLHLDNGIQVRTDVYVNGNSRK